MHQLATHGDAQCVVQRRELQSMLEVRVHVEVLLTFGRRHSQFSGKYSMGSA